MQRSARHLRKLIASDTRWLAKTVTFPQPSCWPIGTPGFLLYQVQPVYFIQSPKEVVMVWQADHQIRHVYLNVPHSAHPAPSWFGESIGHYEGDTLVVDTIGISTRTFVDNFETPHTDQLDTVERFRMSDNGTRMEVALHVEDPGGPTTTCAPKPEPQSSTCRRALRMRKLAYPSE